MADHVEQILNQWKKHRPDLDCSPMGVIGRMSRMTKFMESPITETINQHELSQIEFDILATLRRSDEALTPTQLYKDNLLSSGATSTKLDQLEKKGWLIRKPSEHDRRSCFISLTKEGQEKIDMALNAHVENETALLNALSEEEQDQLAALLQKWLVDYEKTINE